MVNDLLNFEIKDLIQESKSKSTFMVISKETVTINRIKIVNLKESKEYTFENNAEHSMTLDDSYSVIKPIFFRDSKPLEFQKLDYDIAEKFVLSQSQADVVKQQIQLIDNPKPYPKFITE